jgi:TonB family protein
MGAHRDFKAGYRRRFDLALALSIVLNFFVLGFTPALQPAPYQLPPSPPSLVSILPEWNVPDPPQEVQRPVIPIEALDSEEVVEEIPNTTLDPSEVSSAPLPVPPPPADAFSVYDRKPLVLVRVAPEYPQLARNMGIEGVVLCRLTIGTDGRVEEVVVLRSTAQALNEHAVAALKQWVFRPAEQSGNPVRVTIVVPCRFSLDHD